MSEHAPRKPIFREGRVLAMPDKVGRPLVNFDPEEHFVKSVPAYSIKGVTREIARHIFDYIADKPMFLFCTEAKAVRDEQGYSMLEYNTHVGDPLQRFGRSAVKSEMEKLFWQTSQDALDAGDADVFYDFYLQTFED